MSPGLASAKSKSSSAPKASPASKRKAEADEEPQTLIEKAEAKVSTRAKKTKLSVEERAEAATVKALKDNFRGWSSEHLYLNLQSNMSLRDRIYSDKLAWLSGQREPMGKCYYLGLKELYKRKEEGVLEVNNEAEDEDPKLVRALTVVYGKKRNLQDLREWLAHSPICNQRNLVALFRCCMSMSPRHSSPFNELGIFLMEWVAKNKVDEKFPSEVKVLKGYMNACLLKSVADLKRHDMTKTQWFENYKHLARLVVDVEAAGRCFGCTGNWLDVQKDLELIVMSGELGQTLFGLAWSEVAGDKARLLMRSSLSDLKRQKELSQKSLDNIFRVFKERMADKGCNALEANGNTKVSMKYLGLDITIVVHSVLDEWECQAWAHIKSAAIMCGSFAELWGEKSFAKKCAATDGVTVSQDVVAGLLKVRKMAAKYCDDEGGPISKATLQNVLKEHAGFLQLQDKRFRIERAFFEHLIGGGADGRFKELVLEALPAEKDAITMGEARERLDSILSGVVYKFANPNLQVAGQAVSAQVHALVESRSITKPKVDDPFLVQCKARMALWYHFEAEGQANIAAGEASALAAFAHYEKQIESKSRVPYVDLQRLLSFGWLLGSEKTKQVFKWADGMASVLSKPGGTVKRDPATPKPNNGSAKSHVSSLFKKSGSGL